MQVKVETQPKATVKLIVTIPNDKVKEAFEKSLDLAVETTEIEGFRKGKGPRELVRDKIGVNKLYGDVINSVIQTYYPQALKENHILAIANPKVELQNFDIEKDLQFTATVATRPEVTLGDYKKALKDYYETKKAGAKKDDHVHLTPNEVINILVKESQAEISDLLIEDETQRMMARLVDQAQSIGLSMEQYLKAQNKSAEQLQKEYATMSETNLRAEFVMSKLIVDNNIEISDAEIDEMVKASGAPDAAKQLEDPMEKFYVKSILQKNKLISSLIQEIEGENYHEHK